MFIIIQCFKKTIKLIFAVFYFLILNLTHKKGRRIIIYYHDVKKKNIESFRRQMTYLVKKCIVVSPSKIKTSVTSEAKVMVAIIFDDAFESIFNNARPILKELGLVAGISVPVGNIGQRPYWKTPFHDASEEEKVMNKEQIVELDNDKFEILSHAFSHSMLTKINDSELDVELVNSKHILEKLVGHEVVGVVYPYGACDARVCNAAQKAGYKFGFTIEPSMVDDTTDNLMIGRFRTFPHDNLFTFKLKVNGAYQWGLSRM